MERKDGTDMTYDDEIIVSPFISGVRPMDFNIYSVHGGANMMLKNGVLYTLTKCDDLEIFADRTIYLAVMDGVNLGEGYDYDEKSGDITRNEKYEKLNLLFKVDFDKSKADPKAAQKYLNKILGETPTEEALTEDYEGHNDLTHPEKVIRQSKLVKGSKQELTPDKYGVIRYINDEIDLGTSAKAVKKNGIDTLLLYGENDKDKILVFTYENGKYFGRVYTCNQSITRKSERKK